MQSDQERKFSIFDSHPMTETRLKDIQKNSTGLKSKDQPCIAADRAALFDKLDGMWCGENPETGLFHKTQFLHSQIGFTITFPAGWTNRNTPQYVISHHPKKEAALLLAVSKKELEPEAAGQKFIKEMKAKGGIDPSSTRKISIGEFPAFVASYLDRSGKTPVYFHFCWVTMAGKSYELIGLASEKHSEELKNAALSLRPLTPTERGSITGKRFRVVTARQAEKLDSLSARSGNAWSPAYTAIVNGLNPDASLSDGQLLKIARVEPVTQKITSRRH
jgi:predicted Zn-dependent protease